MKQILVIVALIVFISCGDSQEDKIANHSKASHPLAKKVETNKVESDTLSVSKRLIGIWSGSEAENGFQISKSTFYYPEHDKSYKYEIVGDSIKLHYDNYYDSFAFKFKGQDTLILTGIYGEQVMERRK